MQMCEPQQQAEIIEVKFLTAGLEIQPPPSSCPVCPLDLQSVKRGPASCTDAGFSVAQTDINNALQVHAQAIGCFHMLSQEVNSWLAAEGVSYRNMSMFGLTPFLLPALHLKLHHLRMSLHPRDSNAAILLRHPHPTQVTLAIQPQQCV